jgi:hypothetical protein
MLLSLLNSHSTYTSAHSGTCMNERAHNLKASVSAALLPNRPLNRNRVGGGVAPPPLTPPDMRARIRRFVKPFDRDAARFG